MLWPETGGRLVIGRGDNGALISIISAFALVGAGLLVKPGGPSTVRPISDTAPPEKSLIPTRVPARLWQDPVEAGWERVNAVVGGGRVATLWKRWVQARTDFAGRFWDEKTPYSYLPIVVDGSSKPETREMRLRSRYAVRAAMDHLGYRPVSASELDYIPVPLDTQSGAVVTSEVMPVPEDRQIDFVPVTYEVFALEDRDGDGEKPNRVCVCWIDARLVGLTGTPVYGNVTKLFSLIFRRYAFDPPILSLLGSDDLVGVMRAGETGRIFYPKATAPRENLLEAADLDLAAHFPNLRRPIPSDDYSLATLIQELDRRIPQPGKKSKRRREVWLIAEHDTLYSGTMVKSFRRLMKVAGEPEPVVRHISYLKGIDGNLPNLEQAWDQGRSKPIQNLADVMEGFVNPKREQQQVFDRRQVDYLQRLATRLRREQLDKNLNDRVQAIGVLGSDVFDKLMVLQIFRKHFPDVVYFTTDLDSVYLQNNIPEATRNLVIASPYGLDPMLEGRKGPEVDFRDSYQTSLFRTVVEILAGTPPETKNDPAGNPLAPIRLWEVGRSSFYELQQKTRVSWERSDFDLETGAERGELPRNERAYSSGKLLSVWGAISVLAQAGIALLVLGWMKQGGQNQVSGIWRRLPEAFRRFFEGDGIRPWLTGRVVIGGLLLLVAFGLPLVLKGLMEPFAWFDGISIWPSVIIRGIVAVVGFVYFVSALRRVERTRQALEREIDGGISDPSILRYPGTPSVKRSVGIAALLSCLWFIPFLPLVMRLLQSVSSSFFTPARSLGAFVANEISVVLAVGTLVLLTWLAVVQQVRLRDWLRKLRQWVEKEKGVIRPEVVDEIADHTNEVSQTVVYPFVILLLMLASRHVVFDSWNIPPALLVTCGIILALLLGSGFSLNRSAIRLKASQQNLVSVKEREERGEREAVVWQHWEVATGPFGNWRSQPVVRAVVVAGAGVGLGFMEPLLRLFGG